MIVKLICIMNMKGSNDDWLLSRELSMNIHTFGEFLELSGMLEGVCLC